jgi:hypothetical protein
VDFFARDSRANKVRRQWSGDGDGSISTLDRKALHVFIDKILQPAARKAVNGADRRRPC